jgi:NADH-quinone oxidoreductase subunit E
MSETADPSVLNEDLNAGIMERVNEVVDRFAGKPGCLIPVLEACQEIVGYIPIELQEYLGRCLNIPGSDIYGVVSFYSYFSMVPKGRHLIKVCKGTACYVKGIAEVLNRLQSEFHLEVGGTTEDRRFSLEAVRCVGACGLAPVMVVDADTYGDVRPDKVASILEQYQ